MRYEINCITNEQNTTVKFVFRGTGYTFALPYKLDESLIYNATNAVCAMCIAHPFALKIGPLFHTELVHSLNVHVKNKLRR